MSERVKESRVIPAVAAVIAMSVGGCVLLGWALDVALERLHPALAPMKANTALALLLSGIALWFARREGEVRWVGRASALCVMMIGAATLLEYATGQDLHIDQLLVTDAAAHTAPGRMPLATALCITLVGGALLAINTTTERFVRPAQWLALTAGTISFTAFVGYLYGAEALYKTSTFAAVALHTAITLNIMCVGILYARPHVGIMRVMTQVGTATSVRARRLVPAMVVLPIFFGWLRLMGERAGLYHTEFGLAIFALSNVIVLSALVWKTSASQLRLELEARDAMRTVSEQDHALVTDQQFLSDTTETIRALTDEARVFHEVAACVGRFLGASRCHLAEVDVASGTTTIREDYADGLPPAAGAYPLSMFSSETVAQLRGGELVVVEDAATDPRTREKYRTEYEPRGLGSYVAVPVMLDDTWCAILWVSAPQTRHWLPRELGVIRSLGDRAWSHIVQTRQEIERAALAADVVASEQRYRDLYENAPDMYLTADLVTGTITDCNTTLCDRLGYARTELLGQPMVIVYQPESIAKFPDRLAAFRSSGDFVDVERQLRCKDGSSIEVSLNLQAVRDSAGQIIGARAVWRDITRRKHADRDRQFQLQLGDEFQTSTDPAESLVAVCTRLGEYLGASACTFTEIDLLADRVTTHAGYPAGIPVGVHSVSLYGEQIPAACRRGAPVVVEDAATDPRTAATFEGAYRSADVRAYIVAPLMRHGTWVACLGVSSARPRAWEEREIALVTLIGERIWLWVEHLRVLSELRQRDVEAAIQHTERRFRALVEGVKDYAIFLLDPEGNVATWNAGAERLKGYASAEIVGKNFSVFATAEDLQVDHPGEMLTVARRDGRYEEEGWRVRKDGSRFWASVLLTALYDRDGVIDGFAKITRDFTVRRSQHEALTAQRVALVASLKEREVLLQEVHHRVKNNLQVISSLINMQVRKLDLGSTRDALVECQTRVQTIALIHEKLYQSKDYARVEFAEYARSLAANVFQAIGISPGLVTLDLAIDDIPLGIDRAIPCGLLMNELITNSLKHGLKGNRRGTIRVEFVRTEDARLRLTVSDNGVGLPENFDIANSQSMGLQLVCTLSEQLDATLVVNGDGGASFQLTFAGSE